MKVTAVGAEGQLVPSGERAGENRANCDLPLGSWGRAFCSPISLFSTLPPGFPFLQHPQKQLILLRIADPGWNLKTHTIE